MLGGRLLQIDCDNCVAPPGGERIFALGDQTQLFAAAVELPATMLASLAVTLSRYSWGRCACKHVAVSVNANEFLLGAGEKAIMPISHK